MVCKLKFRHNIQGAAEFFFIYLSLLINFNRNVKGQRVYYIIRFLFIYEYAYIIL